MALSINSVDSDYMLINNHPMSTEEVLNSWNSYSDYERNNAYVAKKVILDDSDNIFIFHGYRKEEKIEPKIDFDYDEHWSYIILKMFTVKGAIVHYKEYKQVIEPLLKGKQTEEDLREYLYLRFRDGFYLCKNEELEPKAEHRVVLKQLHSKVRIDSALYWFNAGNLWSASGRNIGYDYWNRGMDISKINIKELFKRQWVDVKTMGQNIEKG